MVSEFTCRRIRIWVALILGAGIAAGILVPAGPGWDFANFYDAGHKVLAGQIQDLYNADAPIDGKAPEGHLAYYGTPLSALLLAPLAWMPPGVAMLVFKIQGTIAMLIGLWLLYSANLPFAEKAGLGDLRYSTAFLAAALLFQPFWTIYRVGGQTTPTVFLGFVLALICITSDRPLAAAVCMVAAVAIKPAFALMFGLLAVLAGLRFLAFAVATGLATAALSVLAMGWSIHQRFLEHLGAGKISPWVYNSSISSVFDTFRAENPVWNVAALGTRLLTAGLVFMVLLRGRKQIAFAAARQHFLFLLATVFGLLLMPVVWEHYLSVLFIPMAFFLAMLPRLGSPEKRLVASICILCCTQNLILSLWLYDHLSGSGGLVQIAAGVWKSAPLVLFTGFLYLHGERLAGMYKLDPDLWRGVGSRTDCRTSSPALEQAVPHRAIEEL